MFVKTRCSHSQPVQGKALDLTRYEGNAIKTTTRNT